jgi:hypothetical protein
MDDQDVGRGLRILGDKDGMPPLPDLALASIYPVGAIFINQNMRNLATLRDVPEFHCRPAANHRKRRSISAVGRRGQNRLKRVITIRFSTPTAAIFETKTQFSAVDSGIPTGSVMARPASDRVIASFCRPHSEQPKLPPTAGVAEAWSFGFQTATPPGRVWD